MAKKSKKDRTRNTTSQLNHINAPAEAMAVNNDPNIVTEQQVRELSADLHERNIFESYKPMRERILKVNYDVIEMMCNNNPIINAIINKRCEQMRPFCHVADDDKDRGFKIVPRRNAPDNIKNDKDTMALLEDFFMQTGFMYDDEREDDFADFIQLLTREALTFDQNTTEIQRTNRGEVYAFWYIDGTSIKRVDEKKGAEVYGKKYKFIQVDKQNRVITKFTNDDLIFDYMHKRARLKYRGYGYAKAEQCIDIITTILFSFSYNKDLFMKDKIPKGFIKVMGDINDATIRKVRQAWINEMEGYGGKFKVPIVPSGKDGVGIEWQSLGMNNRDMEYDKLMNLMMSIIGAVFGIDLAEVGIKTDNYSPMIGESGDGRLQHSKDTGLGSLLMYSETYCNKILSKITPWYNFKFTGVKNDDREAEAKIHRAEVESYKTINEIREDQGLEKIEESYADVVLNPQAVQIFNQEKQSEQMGEEGMGEDGLEGEDVSGDGIDDTAVDNAGGESDLGEKGEKFTVVAEGKEDDAKPMKKSKQPSKSFVEIVI